MNTTMVDYSILRVYILPQDVGQRFIDRGNRSLRAALEGLLDQINVSPTIWDGASPEQDATYFQSWATGDHSSLFYIFNTIPSPAPEASRVSDRFAHEALLDLLDNESGPIGLKAKLYPYQARSAALMVQREAAPELQLDPRLEERSSPDGQTYYFCARGLLFLQKPIFYELNKGGILAETMGLGKTLICLAVILATKGHVPCIPPQYQEDVPTRPKVGSLMQMAAASVTRTGLPWRPHFDRIERETGNHMTTCLDALQATPPEYSIPVEPMRWNRKTTLPPPRKLKLGSGTLIVVPRNLLHQWQSEMKKHVEDGALKLLVMDNPRQSVPPVAELLEYDIVMFSRTRFEIESRDGADEQGRRAAPGVATICRCPYIGASRTRNCTCLRNDELYVSPLKQIHWLRLIIDEGHSFSSATSNAALVAEKLVTAERRWVVSGTPAKDLLGAEVDSATNGEHDSLTSDAIRNSIMQQRKQYNAHEDTTGAVKDLGKLAKHFLKVRPYAECDMETRAEWEDTIYRHEHYRQRTYSAFSPALRRTLESLVVKTQWPDVERDIELPPLTHRTVYLEPCFFDKLTANLFIQVLRGNAVTSERTDVDYLFHKNSAKAKHDLIRNLRQSNFTWTGFSSEDVIKSLKVCRGYLEKEDTKCTLNDRLQLLESMSHVEGALESSSWKALSETHEMGMFVDDWPEASAGAWNMGETTKPLLLGVTQALQAQAYVNGRLSAENALEGLDALGHDATRAALTDQQSTKPTGPPEESKSKIAIPLSCVAGETSTAKRHSMAAKANLTPRRSSLASPAASTPERSPVTSALASSKTKRPFNPTVRAENEPLVSKTRLIGTASAKLTYLLDRIAILHKEEKILIFYDGENAAFYIAQCLEMLHIKHLIYARGLPNERKARYIVAFDKDVTIRVLLMDVACGSHGLNVNAASRVFIINPINKPSIEAQAIKRSHRIGQTRPVEVETLILKGTIEEAMFERAKSMTRKEHRDAKNLEDDDKIQSLIQTAKVIPLRRDDHLGYASVARLQYPQRIFGRTGHDESHIEGIDEARTKQDGLKPAKRSRISKSQAKQVPVTAARQTLPIVTSSLFGG